MISPQDHTHHTLLSSPRFFHPEAVDFEVSQYRIYYASNWEGEWHAASPATQQRLAEDGKVYTVAEFVQHLGGF
jgi:hypothetical protein